jgi:hypothetical protein
MSESSKRFNNDTKQYEQYIFYNETVRLTTDLRAHFLRVSVNGFLHESYTE